DVAPMNQLNSRQTVRVQQVRKQGNRGSVTKVLQRQAEVKERSAAADCQFAAVWIQHRKHACPIGQQIRGQAVQAELPGLCIMDRRRQDSVIESKPELFLGRSIGRETTGS